jgi:hypothetical protein
VKDRDKKSYFKLTLKNKSQALPGWTLNFDEISNNVYKVVLTDSFGRQAATTDYDLERAVKTCEGYAFDIERQISKDWSRFLFDYAMLKLEGTVTFSNGDPKTAYGSWGVRVKDKIVTYEGRDDVLIARDSNADAFDYKAIALKDLSFDTFNEYIDFLK